MEKETLTAAQQFARLGELLDKDGGLHADRLKLDLSEKIYEAMEANGITEAELARRIGASRSYVNKVLQGDTNFTVESLVKIGRAVNCELKIELARPATKAGNIEGQVTYVMEKPIDVPLVMSAMGSDRRNVINLSDFRASKKIEVKMMQSGSKERRHAAL